jgi:hypothetical protein
VAEEKKNFNKYHRKLKLFYRVEGNKLIFQDDVVYSIAEIYVLRQKKDFDYDTIHNAKKIFQGVVVG